MIPWLSADLTFPPLSTALTDQDGANGLLAAGGDLSPQRLLAAYRLGIFPWTSEGNPLLWWSPDPRMVLIPDRLKISRSLAKTLRHKQYEVRLDTAFRQVIEACAQAPRVGQGGTWISTDMQHAYTELHQMGIAHSVETWCEGKLVGGLYGVALGRAFFGESMFARTTDASKIALAHLCAFMHQKSFGIIDCQMETTHLASLGAMPISRKDFSTALDRLCVRAADGESLEQPRKWAAHAIDGFFRPNHGEATEAK